MRVQNTIPTSPVTECLFQIKHGRKQRSVAWREHIARVRTHQPESSRRESVRFVKTGPGYVQITSPMVSLWSQCHPLDPKLLASGFSPSISAPSNVGQPKWARAAATTRGVTIFRISMPFWYVTPTGLIGCFSPLMKPYGGTKKYGAKTYIAFSVYFLAETSVRSPGKLFIFSILRNFLWIRETPTKKNGFWKYEHW